jgi:transcriptional regulator with XRE-family HTH domain
MDKRRYPPNRLLSWERLQHGWSYEEVAERIRAEMRSSEETDTGLTANTVRRWETGERWPEPRYRKYLVTVFGKPASELGLLTPDELSLRPDTDLFNELKRLWGSMSRENGDSGITRSNVLRGLLGAGALPLIAPLLSMEYQIEMGSSEDSIKDPGVYATIVRCHRTLYWTCPPRSLFEASYAHTQLGVSLMRGTGGDKSSLATAVAESAMLTGRLAFFDLGQAAIAERCYDVALAATREGGDHSLAAAVLGHMAFIPAFSNDSCTARALLAAAHQHAWHGVCAGIRSWLHCVASETESRARCTDESQRHVSLAENAFNNAGQPEWFDFYDRSRLDSFAGYAALVAGDEEEATRRLRLAFDHLGINGAKQRSVVLADLALANASEGDEAANYLHKAIDAIEADWYSTGFSRIRKTRLILGDSHHGTQLDERLNALATRRAALPSG